MPTLIAFIAGTIGAVLGFSPFGVGIQAQDSYSYFSIPEFDI